METLESRASEVYRDQPIEALYAPFGFAQADSVAGPLKRLLGEVAEEVSLGALYAMQALTLVTAIIAVVTLSSASAWMVLAAAGLAVAFLAIVASAGFYLISIKNASKGERS